jgi:hypothetical protein
MNAETIAALERAASFLLSETDNNLEPIPEYVADAALIRALIEREQAGGERAQIVARCRRCGGTGWDIAGSVSGQGADHHYPCPMCNAAGAHKPENG